MGAKPVWLLVAAGTTLFVSAMAALQAAPGLGVRRVEVRPLVTIQYRRGEAIAADELAAALAARGYRIVSTPRRKGEYYVVEALGRRGERATIVVDAWTGEISGLRRRRVE